jgi:gas vesicle protein
MGGVIAPAIGLVAAGAAFGAGMGLVFAPLSGRRLREDVGGRFDRLRDRFKKAPHSTRSANASP